MANPFNARRRGEKTGGQFATTGLFQAQDVTKQGRNLSPVNELSTTLQGVECKKSTECFATNCDQ
jgi:hypothetical protein